MATHLVTRRFSLDEYHQMIHAGILTEDDRVELLQGEIIEMAPIGSRHAACVDRLSRIFQRHTSAQIIIRTQSPIRLDARSEPQPDLSILNEHPTFYADTHPGPADVLLAIEVADTSLETDTHTKIPLYARSGIAEVWVVDLLHNVVTVYRQPASHEYQMIQQYHLGETIVPQSIPDFNIMVSDFLS